MTEQRRIQYAKEYLESMANGINPLTKETIPETDLVRDPHIINCLNYVAYILGSVLENGSTADQEEDMRTSRPKRPRFFMTEEQKTMLTPSKQTLYIRDFAKILDNAASANHCRGISPNKINDWLLSIGMLELYDLGRKTPSKRATPQGESIGLSSYIYTDANGNPSYRNRYSPEAQQFIIDNIDALLEFVQR